MTGFIKTQNNQERKDGYISIMEELKKFIENGLLSDSQILEILQDYGIISDNCYKISHIGNVEEALNFLVNHLGF